MRKMIKAPTTASLRRDLAQVEALLAGTKPNTPMHAMLTRKKAFLDATLKG